MRTTLVNALKVSDPVFAPIFLIQKIKSRASKQNTVVATLRRNKEKKKKKKTEDRVFMSASFESRPRVTLQIERLIIIKHKDMGCKNCFAHDR